MPAVLRSILGQKASNVLLHELYHWKQICEGAHKTLPYVTAEQEASKFSDAREPEWLNLLPVAARSDA
jgi:hypothetical protein